MKTVHLYGHMLEKFGGPFNLDIETPAEAVRALCVQLPGFEMEVRKADWRVVRGDLDGGDEVGEEALGMSLGRQEDIHLIPVIGGANSGGGMLVVGAIMIAAAFMSGGATIALWGPMATMLGATGLGMAIGGIITMATKIPGADTSGSNTAVEERASFLFDGPVNQSKGAPARAAA